MFHSRADRAEQRLKELKDALIQRIWAWAYQISWAEFWDMHSLFETSQPPFGYMTSESLKVLTSLRNHWQHNHDGPLVTMDAGANVHLLFRKDQGNQINSIKDSFTRDFALIDSRDFNGYVETKVHGKWILAGEHSVLRAVQLWFFHLKVKVWL